MFLSGRAGILTKVWIRDIVNNLKTKIINFFSENQIFCEQTVYKIEDAVKLRFYHFWVFCKFEMENVGKMWKKLINLDRDLNVKSRLLTGTIKHSNGH